LGYPEKVATCADVNHFQGETEVLDIPDRAPAP
jgi:hypothetical protein